MLGGYYKKKENNPKIFLLKKSKFSFEIPIVLPLLRYDLGSVKKRSTIIPWLTKDLAKLKLVNPPPIIPSFIIFLILTIKIR